jgi:aryl-alcohol dehydrogenase-like predicted oxidoreductase
MEKRVLGKTAMQVSVLGYGAAGIGFMGATAEAAALILNGVLDAGINVIDTAECYGNSEELIGEVLNHRRSQYHLFTKCGHAHGLDYNDWDPALIMLTIERSLKRLQTDYLDLLQLHSCSERILRKGDVIEVLQRARSAGKTRFIGYTGDSKAALYAVECGAFDTLQTSLNIADQEAISLTVQRANERNMGIIAKRALANVAWTFSRSPQDLFKRPYWERLQRLDYPFLKGNSEDALRTALSYTLSVPGVHSALVGTVKSEHLRSNLLGVRTLSAEQFGRIRDRWLAVASPDWTGANEARPVSVPHRVKDAIRRVRRIIRRALRP